MNEGLGVGLAERDVAQRLLATAVILVMALASVFAFIWMAFHWPFWIAFPCGLAALAAALGVSLLIVNRIVPKKVKAPQDHFGEE